MPRDACAQEVAGSDASIAINVCVAPSSECSQCPWTAFASVQKERGSLANRTASACEQSGWKEPRGE